MTLTRRSTRCRVPLAIAFLLSITCGPVLHAKPYWFETYQRAVELIDADRSEEASSMLEQLIAERPTPISGIKVPGDQFIDYLPYYQMARAQVKLGHFDEATRVLTTSESYGELTWSTRHLKEYAELRKSLNAGSARQ